MDFEGAERTPELFGEYAKSFDESEEAMTDRNICWLVGIAKEGMFPGPRLWQN
jgi:hypothetical protein